jgi:hypothetical protein
MSRGRVRLDRHDACPPRGQLCPDRRCPRASNRRVRLAGRAAQVRLGRHDAPEARLVRTGCCPRASNHRVRLAGRVAQVRLDRHDAPEARLVRTGRCPRASNRRVRLAARVAQVRLGSRQAWRRRAATVSGCRAVGFVWILRGSGSVRTPPTLGCKDHHWSEGSPQGSPLSRGFSNGWVGLDRTDAGSFGRRCAWDQGRPLGAMRLAPPCRGECTPARARPAPSMIMPEIPPWFTDAARATSRSSAPHDIVPDSRNECQGQSAPFLNRPPRSSRLGRH